MKEFYVVEKEGDTSIKELPKPNESEKVWVQHQKEYGGVANKR